MLILLVKKELDDWEWQVIHKHKKKKLFEQMVRSYWETIAAQDLQTLGLGKTRLTHIRVKGRDETYPWQKVEGQGGDMTYPR